MPKYIEGEEEYEGEEPGEEEYEGEEPGEEEYEGEEPEDNSNYPPEYWHTFEEFRPDE
jgi:hypothetical protein